MPTSALTKSECDSMCSGSHPRFRSRYQQVFDLGKFVQQGFAAAVGDAVDAADEGQFDIARLTEIPQQGLVVAFGNKYGIETFVAQSFGDIEPELMMRAQGSCR
jgi:hypothetical protein